jgi:energy-converting hydrogenase B subunit D
MEAMTLLGWAFDTLLGLGLLWFAWRCLVCPKLFKAIVLFIAFGLLMVLAWVRLDAPDVALAEAAIGAGLTGALLMAALARLQETGRNASGYDDGQSPVYQVSNDDREQ